MADLSEKFGAPSYENDKLRAWTFDKKKAPKDTKGIISIDLEKERMYESRVYQLEGIIIQMFAKILAKQNLKTGEIDVALASEWEDKKQVHLTQHCKDENEYIKMVKKFEIFLATQFSIDPSKVLVTSAQEWEKSNESSIGSI